MNDAMIAALMRAVQNAPDDAALRCHLAEVLLSAGRRDDAVAQLAVVLSAEPAMTQALQLMLRCVAPPAEPAAAAEPDERGFDWGAAESQVGDIAGPTFVRGSTDDREPPPPSEVWDVETSTVRMADVGGMVDVKQQLERAFLAPMRNPELRRLYGTSMHGGLLLYGPPGCGKTYLARAIAGELGAKFVSAGLADILDPYLGQSERNLHGLFDLARRNAPCVLFFDEVDAIGMRRTNLRTSALRSAVNQLLTELDGVGDANDDVFVLAATNQPWDVDPALRRPGRFDRTLLVLPPDEPARRVIFQAHLARRPVEGIVVGKLAARSAGLSGADIAYVCQVAAEHALADSVRSGAPRLIGMRDLISALGTVKPSTDGWFASARNVVLFSDDDGTYAQLRAYMKRTKQL